MMRALQHARSARLRRGFTLAELLAVIIIMSLLMVVVVPNIGGLTRGASLRGATMQVRSALLAARQTAVAKRADVSVLFPTGLTGTDATKNYRAIAIYAVGLTNSWYVSNWEYLPPGVLFNNKSFAASDKVTSVPMDQGTVAASMPGITFNRLGERTGAAGTSTTATMAQLWLMEGFMNGASPVYRKNSAGTNEVNILFPAGIIQVKHL